MTVRLTDKALQYGFITVEDVRNGPCEINRKYDTCSVCKYWTYAEKCTLLRRC